MAQPIICTVYVTGNAGVPGRADSGKTRFRKQTQKARWSLSLLLSGTGKLSGRASFSPIWPWKRTWTYLSQEFLFSCMKTRGFITHLANCMQSFSSCLRMELSTKMQRRWWPWGSFIKGWHEDPLVEMFQNTNPQPEEVTFLFAITCSVNNL